MIRSNDIPLDLLEVLHLDISPHGGRHKGNRQNRRRSDQHSLLRVSVRPHDRVPRRRSPCVLQLNSQLGVDVHQVRQRVFREVLFQLDGKHARPDGRRDRPTDCAADAGEHALHGEDDRDVSLRRRGHGGHLLRDDERAARERDEDLAHDDVSDVDVWLAELDHEADTQDGQRHAEVQRDPLEAAGPTNHDADDERPECGANRVDVANIGSFRYGEVVDDLEERGEVAVPDIEGDEDGARQDARAQDGAVGQEVVRDEGNGCEVLLVQGESDDQDATNDDEADHEGRFPAVSLVRVEGEGKEEKRQASGDEQQADDVEFEKVVFERLCQSALALALWHDAQLLRLAVVPVEEGAQGSGHDGGHDGESAVAPSEAAGAFEEARCDGTADPDGCNVGRRDKGEHEGSILQSGGVGHEDGNRVCHAVVSDKSAPAPLNRLSRDLPNPVEHLRRSVRLHVVAGGHHDQSNSQKAHHHEESLRTPPDIKNLCQRELPDSSNQTGHDADGGRERVLLEGRRDVRYHRVGHALLHGVDKVDDPNTATVSSIAHTSNRS